MKNILKNILLFFVAWACSSPENNDEICINQIGFYPESRKIAVLKASCNESFFIVNAKTGETVYQNTPENIRLSPFSDSYRTILNFTDFTQKGTYYVLMGDSQSPTFMITDTVLESLSRAVQKAFYYNRSGMELLPEYASFWSRKEGHLDTCVYVHPSAASSSRKANSTINASKGWYGAGDYNKYVPSTCFAMGLILNIYQLYPSYFDTLKLNIPQPMPLSEFWNEMNYGVEWLLTMQDEDGGVYHKLTAPYYEPFVSPKQCLQRRYVMAKSVSATLDFAAVMAKLYYMNNREKKWLNAAQKAFNWALANPEAYYNQQNINAFYKPEVSTETYEDNFVDDEFFWAAVELYIATNDAKYLTYVNSYTPKRYNVPQWNKVYALGYFSMLQRPNAVYEKIIKKLNTSLQENCDQLLSNIENSPFDSPFGYAARCFHKGSVAEESCGGVISLLHAYQQTHEPKYLNAAVDNLDYILGRNAVGVCFVTGFGTRSVSAPHHRLSYSDSVLNPIPGMLVGGPNIGQEDRMDCGGYSSNIPDESYIDNPASFSSNQPTIHWNAEFLYAVSFMDILMRENSQSHNK